MRFTCSGPGPVLKFVLTLVQKKAFESLKIWNYFLPLIDLRRLVFFGTRPVQNNATNSHYLGKYVLHYDTDCKLRINNLRNCYRFVNTQKSVVLMSTQSTSFRNTLITNENEYTMHVQRLDI